MVKFAFFVCFLLVGTTVYAIDFADASGDIVEDDWELLVGSNTTEEPNENATTVVPTTVPAKTTTVPHLLKCEDEIDCSTHEAAGQCKMSQWKPLLYVYCRKTCNFCNECIDADDRCKVWVPNGFCTNTFFEKIRETCAKSCGLCS
uniref:ShKT domain-containing protein n=1 Tax=Panagrellus redivivus TaxID=6233 RepID=A0A7E4VA41_PANRE